MSSLFKLIPLGIFLTFSQKQPNSYREGLIFLSASQVVLVVKKPPANAADIRDVGLISGWGRSPGGSDGNPL